MRPDEPLLQEYLRESGSVLSRLLVEALLEHRQSDDEAQLGAAREKLQSRLEEIIRETDGD